MLTLREQASSGYNAVVSLGRRSVRGADMREVSAGRLAAARRVERVIDAAIGSPTYSERENSDADLTIMLERTRTLVADYERDSIGWARVLA